MNNFAAHKTQWSIFGVLVGIILIMTLVLYIWDRAVFTLLLGKANPLLVVLIAAVIGVMCFTYFFQKGWFVIYQPGNKRGYLIAIGLSIFFVMNAVLLDWGFRFGSNINVLPPKGLLYYPIMGFIVEMVFHLLLIAISMAVLTGTNRGFDAQRAMWISIALVSLVEPIFQVIIGTDLKGLDLFGILTGLHILLINLGQLVIFKYFDFSTLFFQRMVYYLLWHVLWGILRLKIFF